MKATKLVTIFENMGAYNENILFMVTANNMNVVQYRLPKIKRFGERAVKLGKIPPTTFEINEEGNVMTVTQDGKVMVVIEENTVAEMDFVKTNRLKNTFAL